MPPNSKNLLTIEKIYTRERGGDLAKTLREKTKEKGVNNLPKTTEICSYASQSYHERNPYATPSKGCLTKLNPELHDPCSPIYKHNNYLHGKYVRKLLEPQGCEGEIKIISTNICEIKIVTNPKNHVYLFSTTIVI